MFPKTGRKGQFQLDAEETKIPFDPTWACPKCTLYNAATRKRCGACESRRPIANIPMAKHSSQSVTGESHSRAHKRKRDETPHERQVVTCQHQVSVKLSIGGNSKSWKRLKAWWPKERAYNVEADSCDALNENKDATDGINCGLEGSTVSPLSGGSTVFSPKSTKGSFPSNTKLECDSQCFSTPQSTTSNYNLRSRERKQNAASERRQPVNCQHQVVVKLFLGGKSSQQKPLTALWPQGSARRFHAKDGSDAATKVKPTLSLSLAKEEKTLLPWSVAPTKSSPVEADSCATSADTKDIVEHEQVSSKLSPIPIREEASVQLLLVGSSEPSPIETVNCKPLSRDIVIEVDPEPSPSPAREDSTIPSPLVDCIPLPPVDADSCDSSSTDIANGVRSEMLPFLPAKEGLVPSSSVGFAEPVRIEAVNCDKSSRDIANDAQSGFSPNLLEEERTVPSSLVGSIEPSLGSPKKCLVSNAKMENAESCSRVLVELSSPDETCNACSTPSFSVDGLTSSCNDYSAARQDCVTTTVQSLVQVTNHECLPPNEQAASEPIIYQQSAKFQTPAIVIFQGDTEGLQPAESQEIGFSQRMTQMDSSFIYTPFQQQNNFKRPSPLLFSKNLITTVGSPLRRDTKKIAPGDSECHMDERFEDPEIQDRCDPSAGFATAGRHKPIHVTEESLARSSELLGVTSVSFHTAGKGGLVQVSDEALKKANDVWGTECHATKKHALENGKSVGECRQLSRFVGRRNLNSVFKKSPGASNNVLEQTPANAVGFYTAGSGSLVHVSEESMKKADKVWGSESVSADDHNLPTAISTLAKPASSLNGARQSETRRCLIEPALIADGTFPSPGLRNIPHRTTRTRYDMELFQTPAKRKLLTRNFESVIVTHGAFSPANARGSKSVAVTVETASRKSALRDDDSPVQSPDWQTEEMVANEKFARLCFDPIAKEDAPPRESLLFAQRQVAFPEKSTTVCHGLTFSTGFHSAGNRKEIKVSNESIARAASVFWEPPCARGADKHEVTSVSNDCETALSICFHSAGKRTKIAVSENSIARAASIFDEPTLSNGIHTSGDHKEIFAPKESMERAASIVSEPTSSHSRDNRTNSIVVKESFGLTGRGGEKWKTTLNDACDTRNSASPPSLLQKTAGCGSARLSLSTGRPHRSLSTHAPSATTRIFLAECKISTRILPAFFHALRIGQMSENQQTCVDDGVPEITIHVNSVNAASVRFHKRSGLPCYFSHASGISAEIVGTERDIFQELDDLSCKSPLLTLRWIGNHSRWIIWKLASMERRFSAFLAGRYLTYNNLLTQLLERYYREIVRGQRSAVRKILNKDASPSIPMILCVAQVLKFRESPSEVNVWLSSVPQYRVELTDGWYSVEATLDTFLRQMVQNGRIQQGTKLMICDARLEGLEEGVDPLESSYYPLRSPKSISLRLCANGTRLARWNAKLGFVAPSRTIVAQGGKVLVRKVSDVIPGGGNIPLMELIVLRRYPKLFLQQPSKKLQPVNKSIVLTEAEYFSISEKLEQQKEMAIEKVFDEVMQECEQDIDDIAPESWRQVVRSESPEEVYQSLDSIEKLSVDRWKRRRESLLQDSIHKAVSERINDDNSLQECRSVPFVRFLVKSTDSKNSLKCEEATLTVWNPSDDQLDVLQEGAVVRFRELAVRPDRFDGLLQFTASSRTLMELLSRASICSGYAPRKVLNLFRIACASKKVSQTEKQPVRPTEVDTAGIVLKVLVNQLSGSHDARVYLTDESGLVLRIQGNHLSSAFDAHGQSASTIVECERQSVVIFRNLRLLPYDQLEFCAVAESTNVSSRSIGSQNARSDQLLSWASSNEGRMKLRQVAACLDAEVPSLQMLDMDEKIAFGYIAGFSVTHFKRLLISVDCQGEQLHKWDFPIPLLQEAMDACHGSVVALNAEDEASAGQLKLLGDLFRARDVLLRFRLRRVRSSDSVDGFRYEVCHVKRANVGALASLHVVALSENAQY